ncbi:HlyD family secretion protein [Pseudomonas sp. EL_65y_Pfl2_R95]|uniref:HlyD family secretion protein n=1 Tax=Pseudomonas sp. EL_65y_Pfl2_R95 TaxID=3088698 RepID=UPI0030DD9F29
MPAQLKRRLFVFLAILALVAAAFLAHWWWVGRFHEDTDNAYVQGEITRVSSQLSARVEKVLVQDNQHVEQGELLVELENSDFKLALQRAEATLATREAQLAQTQSTLSQQDSMIAASKADVSASQATLSRAKIDMKRAKTLRQSGYISEERVTTLDADSSVARAQVAKAEADLQAQKQQIDTLQAESKSLNAQIASARADIDQAKLNISRTEIRAPISGFVGQRAARNGQYVQTGAYLMSLVPDQDIWVQANFKETQIGHMRAGQSAELTFDSFPDTPIKGKVDSLFAASGAQFSLLPPDNATGNFTKVVQRIPVKLMFDKDNPLQGLIRPGMSVEVVIDISDDQSHGG